MDIAIREETKLERTDALTYEDSFLAVRRYELYVDGRLFEVAAGEEGRSLLEDRARKLLRLNTILAAAIEKHRKETIS